MKIEKIDFSRESSVSDNEFDYEKILNEAFIDTSKEVPPPEKILSIGQSFFNNKMIYNDTITVGESSAIVAPSKSKKTFFKSAINASIIGGKSNHYFPNMKSWFDPNQKSIIADFDTEQGKHYAHNAMKRVDLMVGDRYEYYMPFTLKKYSPSDRLQFIDRFMDDPRHKGRVKYLSIDGIADLCENLNDLEKSLKVIYYIEKWNDQGAHVNSLIHAVTGTNKAKGHLGSYVQQKAETVMNLSRTDEESMNSPIKVKQTYSRGLGFYPFYFDVNTEGLPQLYEDNENSIL